MWELRALAADDVPAVLALQSRTPEAAQWPAAEYRRISTPAEAAEAEGREAVLVAEAGERIVGFVAFRVAGGECEILNLVVKASSRRSGLGSRLLRQALARAGQVQKVFLEVRKSNAAARAFYEQHGFREAGRRRGYYSSPVEDAVVMALEGMTHGQ